MEGQFLFPKFNSELEADAQLHKIHIDVPLFFHSCAAIVAAQSHFKTQCLSGGGQKVGAEEQACQIRRGTSEASPALTAPSHLPLKISRRIKSRRQEARNHISTTHLQGTTQRTLLGTGRGVLVIQQLMSTPIGRSGMASETARCEPGQSTSSMQSNAIPRAEITLPSIRLLDIWTWHNNEPLPPFRSVIARLDPNHARMQRYIDEQAAALPHRMLPTIVQRQELGAGSWEFKPAPTADLAVALGFASPGRYMGYSPERSIRDFSSSRDVDGEVEQVDFPDSIQRSPRLEYDVLELPAILPKAPRPALMVRVASDESLQLGSIFSGAAPTSGSNRSTTPSDSGATEQIKAEEGPTIHIKVEEGAQYQPDENSQIGHANNTQHTG